MKILQLTFTYGNNMGAMLQAYALNKTLESMGNECYFLPFYEKPFEILKKKTNLVSAVLKLLRNYKKRNYTPAWVRNFNQFLYNTCQFAPYTQLDQLSKIQNEYDLFIVGSDQIWNVKTYNCEHCLLKWVEDKNKRFSYAASLGSYSIRLKNDPIATAIKDFSTVSFREKIDYEDAMRNGIDCRLDIDPTFLVDKSHWEEITNEKYSYLENCVALFGYDEKSYEFAKKYAKEKKLKLVIANYFGNRAFPGTKILNPPTPTDMLSIIRYASCVVTHSYHVFILSLNLNKQVFYTSHNGKKVNNRFDTVIELFDLQNRETDIENINCQVDWCEFNRRLYELREKSLRYLKGITHND